MFIRVERGSSAPVSRQILEQLRAQCLSGLLRPGDPLPSVRQLARELAVNVNTVVRVYERLAAERLIEMRHGDGTYVLPPSGAADASRQLSGQRDQFVREFDAVVRRGLLLGLEASELRRIFSSSLAAGRKQSAGAAPGDSASTRSSQASENRR